MSKKQNTRFNAYIKETLEMEGGSATSNRPGDGLTQYGVNAVYHPEVRRAIERGTFTQRDAEGVYFEKFYKKVPHIDYMPVGIGFIIFDSKVQGMLPAYMPFIKDYLADIGKLRNDGRSSIDDDTARVLTSLSSEQEDDLLFVLTTQADAIANISNTATMRRQRRNHEHVTNNHSVFRGRATKRMMAAVDLKVNIRQPATPQPRKRVVKGMFDGAVSFVKHINEKH